MPGSEWRLLDLGELPPVETQSVYHAVASCVGSGRSPDTLIICWPASPLVCIGYHQVASKEVAMDRCAERGYPVVRRMLGGGAVLLNSDQLFYQVIASGTNRSAPSTIDGLFRFFLQAPVETYRALGIPAVYRPINDIEVDGRKISGNGGGLIEGAKVITGNIIFDFPFDEMPQLLRVPDEKFRDKIRATLCDRMTTIQRELGRRPPLSEVKSMLIDQFVQVLGGALVPGSLTDLERERLVEITRTYSGAEWLNQRSPGGKGSECPAKKVKISARTSIVEAAHKAPGGLIRALIEVTDGILTDVFFSGDYFVSPLDGFDRLSSELVGTRLDAGALRAVVEEFFATSGVESPGVSAEDVVATVMAAAALR
ncbi:MAG: lipoate--protein ligase [Firmicutes bacterium]|jgi:lipoate-protein ligase A|nr:lipoate--protein ligase [Bacillota bacterium]